MNEPQLLVIRPSTWMRCIQAKIVLSLSTCARLTPSPLSLSSRTDARLFLHPFDSLYSLVPILPDDLKKPHVKLLFKELDIFSGVMCTNIARFSLNVRRPCRVDYMYERVSLPNFVQKLVA